GYKRRFTGSPAERMEQEKAFFCETRLNQFLLAGMAKELRSVGFSPPVEKLSRSGTAASD
ncbi:MAG: hypothetical protein II590_04140, partial [Clostridia bacterium]|nr:hypothetical protein [Clostridia bacterium]